MLQEILKNMPAWRKSKPLPPPAYDKHDAVLQITGAAAAPCDALFNAAAKRRRDDKPHALVTLPGGAAVCRLKWKKSDDAFTRQSKIRAALAPLLALSPRRLAVDARAPGSAADALYTALINIAALPGDKTKKPQAVVLAAAENAGLKTAAVIAEANTLARALTQTPPNELRPRQFIRLAKQLAKQCGIGVTVYEKPALTKMRAGAILAVGRASVDEPPAILRLRWNGRAARRVAVVGKGVCFDTGGVNLKPARHMRGMGKDMAGAAAALAGVWAAARLRLPAGVDAWLALAENAVGARAYRPDEVITALNGKRIEVVHTDAEGRMILADALTLASRDKPALIVSMATLTGTMHVALGERMSGVLTESKKQHKAAMRAAAASGERLCYFPLPADYRRALQSDVADIKQCAEAGEADHIMAALFLREFIAGKPDWLHVDLSAGACKGGLAAAPGPITGFGAAWLLALLRAR